MSPNPVPEDAESGSAEDSEGSEPGSKRARIARQQQQFAAKVILQAPAAAGALKTEAAVATDAAAAAAAAAAAGAAVAPMLASAVALTPEQQQAMLQHLPALTPEALAAAQAALPTAPDGQPLQLTLPLIGPGGESLPSLVLDPAVLFSGQILGPKGEELTQEQVGEELHL